MSDGFVTAFAPASIGNLGVGFDMLGLALAGVSQFWLLWVAVRKADASDIRILEVRGLDGEIHPFLSTTADQNTASIAAKSLWDAHGDGSGLEMIVQKGIPLQSGMGSSAHTARK